MLVSKTDELRRSSETQRLTAFHADVNMMHAVIARVKTGVKFTLVYTKRETYSRLITN